MNSIAFTQQHEIFRRLESVTNYANLNESERNAYDEDLKIFRDFENCMQFSHDKGRAEGRAEGVNSVIKKLFENGMTVEAIASSLRMQTDKIRQIICSH